MLALEELAQYKYGFHDEHAYAYKTPKGLNEAIVREISAIKGEPEWMLQKRLLAYKIFKNAPMPQWGADLSSINFDEITYYAKPKAGNVSNWDMVPDDIKKTFDKIGIPEAEKKFLAGASSQYDSEVVYHNLKKEWEEQGIIFTDMDSGLKEYPEIVKNYFATIIPITDNKFAALNSAVWSGGSFVFIPEGVQVQIPLQAYFRINAEKVGQFERTLIICESGSKCHYVEGCTAPIYSASSLHSAVVELVAKENSHLRYTTIQNWSNNVYNLVTKRAVAHKNAFVEWLDGNIGCLTADSKIFTNNDIKEIKDVGVGDHVYSLDQNFEIVRNKVIEKKENPPTDVYELKTANYRVIKATANHPFLIMRKEGRLTKIKWVRLDKIKTGTVENKSMGADLIAISGEIPDHGKSHKIEFQQIRGIKKIKVPFTSSVDLLWLLGFYIGDGWKEENRIGFAVPRTDKSREKVVRLVKEIFDLECQEHGEITVRVNSSALKDFFDYLKFNGGAKEKRVPNWIFKLPKNQKRAFIQGYVDADGYVRDNHKNMCISSANKELLADVKILAMSCGLHPLKISKWTRIDKLPLGKEIKEYTNYFLYFSDQDIDDPVAFVPILSINKIGKEITYDIEVDGTHNFIANGIIVHNSQITMKYPSVILKEPGARGEVISVAYAGKGQCQDAGGKMIHLAPNTTSRVISKSISQGGGRTSYRGLVKVVKGAKNCKSFVQCDAYMLDEKSRSDTYPTVQVDEDTTTIGHEAKVGKIGNDKLFYLMSRGISEAEALAMIVQGFLEPFTKELPMEYAVELNRLIQIQLEGAVG